ncbi:hypothetical protein ONZ45_g11795 [Pleurotus djamor]|nr:hypothetical protein ONZ45_g11795 [Pleurotus djamor]
MTRLVAGLYVNKSLHLNTLRVATPYSASMNMFDDELSSPPVHTKVTSTGDRLAQPPLTLAARDFNTQNFVPPGGQQELASSSIRQQRGKCRDENCLAAGTENCPAPVPSRRQQPATSLYRHEEQVHRHSHSTLPAFPSSVPAPAFSFEETFAAIPGPLCVPPDWTYGPMPTLPRDEPIASPVPEVSSAIDRRPRTKTKLSASTRITREPVPLQANAGPSRVDGSNDPARALESSATPLYFNFQLTQPIPPLQGQGAHNQADADSTTDSQNVPPPSAMPTLHPSASMTKSNSVTKYIKGFTIVVTDTGDRKRMLIDPPLRFSSFTRQDAAKRHDDSATEKCKNNQKLNVKGKRPDNVSEGMQTAKAKGVHIKPYLLRRSYHIPVSHHSTINEHIYGLSLLPSLTPSPRTKILVQRYIPGSFTLLVYTPDIFPISRLPYPPHDLNFNLQPLCSAVKTRPSCGPNDEIHHEPSVFERINLGSTMTTGTFKLEGKLALITGCTGGIGYSTALALAHHGCSIAVHYHSAQSKATKLVDQITNLNSSLKPATPIRAQAFQADLSNLDDVRRLYQEVISAMGNPDILFNNAGKTGTKVGRSGNIEDVSLEEIEEIWKVNTAQAYLLTQLCIPHMERQGYGRVIFCSSVAAGTGGVIGPHYASSKSALHGLMHWVASRYAKSGITCNAVAPALISDTDMMADAAPELKNIIPIGRFGTPEEVSCCVEVLVNNAYMTNKIVVMDGGITPLRREENTGFTDLDIPPNVGFCWNCSIDVTEQMNSASLDTAENLGSSTNNISHERKSTDDGEPLTRAALNVCPPQLQHFNPVNTLTALALVSNSSQPNLDSAIVQVTLKTLSENLLVITGKHKQLSEDHAKLASEVTQLRLLETVWKKREQTYLEEIKRLGNSKEELRALSNDLTMKNFHQAAKILHSKLEKDAAEEDLKRLRSGYKEERDVHEKLKIAHSSLKYIYENEHGELSLLKQLLAENSRVEADPDPVKAE